jgi:hypothetical protein
MHRDNLVQLLNEMLYADHIVVCGPIELFIMEWCRYSVPTEAIHLMQKYGYNPMSLDEFKCDILDTIDLNWYKFKYNPFDNKFY